MKYIFPADIKNEINSSFEEKKVIKSGMSWNPKEDFGKQILRSDKENVSFIKLEIDVYL